MANEFAGMFQNPALIREDRLAALQQQQAGQRQMGGSMSGLLGQVAAGTGGVMAEGLAGMFGLQTAQEKQAATGQAIEKNIDPNDPESLLKAAEAFQAAGLTKAADAARGKARTIVLQGREDTTYKQAQEDRTRMLKRNTILEGREDWRFQQEKDASERDSQAREIGKLAMQDVAFDPKNPNMIEYYGAKIKRAEQMGRSDLAERYAKELADHKEKVTTRMNSSLGVISSKDYTAAGAVELTSMRAKLAQMKVGTPEYNEQLTEMLEAQSNYAKQAATVKAEEARAEATAKAEGEQAVENRQKTKDELKAEETVVKEQMTFVKQLGEIIDQAENNEIFVGFGAEVKMDAAKFAEAIGITNEEWQTQAANTEKAMTFLSAKILEKIKQLGANPSNADREFLAKTLPMVTTSPEGLKKIHEYLRLRSLQALQELDDKRAYLNTEGAKTGTLDGYKSKATSELKAFLEKEGIKSGINDRTDTSGVKFSKEQQEAWNKGAKPTFVFNVKENGKVVDQIGIYSYPTVRISAGQIIDRFKADGGSVNTDAMLKRASQLERLMTMAERSTDNAMVEITDEDRANYMEEIRAIANAYRQITTGK